MTTEAARADLIAFEKRADAMISQLPVLGLPGRSVLSAIHFVVFLMLRAPALGLPSVAPKGEALMSRLGYLLPLLRRLAPRPIGVDAVDAIGAYHDIDPTREQMGALFSYAHFSQIMPEFHRGYFGAERTETGFRLSHGSATFAEAEAKDILLSEISIPHASEKPQLPDDDVVALARSAPMVDVARMHGVLARKFSRWREVLVEPEVISDDGLRTIFGFDHGTFRRIQAAIFAYAELCEEFAWLIAGWSVRDQNGGGISDEALEWISVNNRPDFVIALVASVSGAESTSVSRFLSYFSMDYTVLGASTRGGDGFFPPIAMFENSMLFSPALVMTFVQARNAVFDFSRLEKRNFDERVSQDLEPVLLNQLVAYVSKTTGWVAHPNVNFPGGEIDLVLSDPESETVVIVQAKGSLPPQGARMAERLAARCKEGLSQLDRFRRLPDAEKRAYLPEHLRAALGSLTFKYALLARSCFGSPEIWLREHDTILLTLPLARFAIGQLAANGRPARLSALPDAVRTAGDRFFTAAKPVWSHGPIQLFDTEISVPLLQFEADVVDDMRRSCFKDA